MKKWIIIIVIACLLLAGGLYWRSRNVADANTINPDDTYKVALGDIVESVPATGAVTSNLDVDVKCQASGQITELPFDISQHVKKGAILMQLDPKLEKQALDAAKINVKVANAKLDQAKANEIIANLTLAQNKLKADADLKSAQIQATNADLAAKRQQELMDQQLGSKADLETAQTQAAQAEENLAAAKVEIQQLQVQKQTIAMRAQDVELAKASLDSANVELDQATTQLDYCTVYSPMDGVVSARDVQVGGMVASSISNVGGGTTIMTISDLSHIFVMASVDESQIGGVRVGQDVNITADSYPGVTFTGKVVRIATTGVNTTNVVTFEVKIEVTSKNKDLLKPVMTTNVEIIEAKKHNVLVVPAQALTQQGDNYYVTLVDGDNTTIQPVKVGMTDGENFEIASGLKAGDTIELDRSGGQSQWNAKRMMKRMGNTIVSHHH